jgi:hypothetical protein
MGCTSDCSCCSNKECTWATNPQPKLVQVYNKNSWMITEYNISTRDSHKVQEDATANMPDNVVHMTHLLYGCSLAFKILHMLQFTQMWLSWYWKLSTCWGENKHANTINLLRTVFKSTLLKWMARLNSDYIVSKCSGLKDKLYLPHIFS